MTSLGKMAVVGLNVPIEVAIAEACALYEQHFGVPATLVQISTSNPASVEAPEGITLERTDNIQPGAAWAGRAA